MSEVLSKWYSLTFNGYQVSDEMKRRITDITLDMKETGANTLTIKMLDKDMEYLTADYLAKEAKVSFKCAWYDSRTEFISFVGYISVVDADYGDTVKLTITCLDESFPMTLEEKTRTWNNVKVSDVAREIFQEYGLKAHVDDTDYTEDSISQSNQNDASFMNGLTSKVGHKVFIWFIEGRHGYFIERKMSVAKGIELGYRKGNNQILTFNPRLTKGKVSASIYTGALSAETGIVVGGQTITNATDGRLVGGKMMYYVNGKWISE